MAKFTFRLQTLLNVKEQIEDNTKNELGIAMHQLKQQKDRLTKIREEIKSQEDAYRHEGTQKITLAKIKQRLEFIRLMQKRETVQQQRVNEEKRNVDKIRERLIEIMKEKKVLEKLREKDWVAFRKEQEKAEQVRVDELVSYKESTKTFEDEM